MLKTESKYISEDGNLLKATVYADVMTMDERLLTLLLSDENIKNIFFKNVNGTLVFDKQKFAWFIESKEFLPDSYTRYTNKIGLTHNGEFISKSNDVVLDFPYKDCVLEGGQDKDDQKRKEIFYNETIASDEINRMLAPKVFTNAKRYTKDRIEENITFNEDDNLIIKGNNLIALSSLLKRYEGKVKCIYIDPPYNTGSDSFGYNDSFNRSTWLTFMKNRLEFAKKLLSEDGAIYVQLDYHQVHYAKILMDSIFGEENFEREIVWRIGWISGYKSVDNNWIRNHDTILFYSKNTNQLDFIKNYIPSSEFKSIAISNAERYPIEDVWNGSEYDDLNSIAIVSFSGETVSKMLEKDDEVKGQKSEKLIERIFKAHTKKGDLVLDFFLGSGTSAAVAHKMGLKYIGIEQLNKHIDISFRRLNKVLQGEQSGTSKRNNWQGGGSFVYCELLENANTLITKVQEATEANISQIKESIYSDNGIIPYITKDELESVDEEFEKLSLEEKKVTLIKLIDKNKLYVNFSDMEDKTFNVSEKDKVFTKSFYMEGKHE
ncbi:DNA methyltransferase [Mycoplasmopsis cynos]|uniref:C-terminal truncated type III restriction-modification system: methylase n=2 Tax=Mycoplasmopsis cynos TaxID=171284 RepID=A0A449AIQ6_9BACT|nr:site-specific DNA-methyltransferase [Mycoplasmopsis cynos]VEU64859.1 C-terminal truncated type III restriction-modification system: methylase [Mycoplasmopsis cynos]